MYAVGQAVIFVTTMARVPLTLAAVGTTGYGLTLVLVALVPWLLLIVGSFTSLVRARASELAAGSSEQLSLLLTTTMHKARRLSFGMAVVAGLSILVPWQHVFATGDTIGPLALKVAVLLVGLTCASTAFGAVSTGLLQASGRTAETNLYPACAALLSLGLTVFAWSLHLSIVWFVIPGLVSACAPFWIATIRAREMSRPRAHKEVSTGRLTADVADHNVTFQRLAIAAGATAPPLFSTGLDPIILSHARGLADTAQYGLAIRLAVLVTLLPSALYPVYWARFGRLRSGSATSELRRAVGRALAYVAGGTAILGALFALLGPLAGKALSNGHINPDRSLYAWFAILGLLAAIQTVLLPAVGGEQTARRVAIVVFALIPVNWCVSYLLAARTGLGVSGPVVASISASVVIIGTCTKLLTTSSTRESTSAEPA